MKIRNLLFGFVLAMMFLFASSFTSISSARPSCEGVCLINYNDCVSSCNGEPGCKPACIEAYSCCKLLCRGGQCTTD
jgi:hypothetical protein